MWSTLTAWNNPLVIFGLQCYFIVQCDVKWNPCVMCARATPVQTRSDIVGCNCFPAEKLYLAYRHCLLMTFLERAFYYYAITLPILHCQGQKSFKPKYLEPMRDVWAKLGGQITRVSSQSCLEVILGQRKTLAVWHSWNSLFDFNALFRQINKGTVSHWENIIKAPGTTSADAKRGS